MQPFHRLLNNLKACQKARCWAACYDDPARAWAECEDPRWQFWGLGRLRADHKRIVLAACDCAELASPYVPPGEDRARQALETARRWCRGKAIIEEVRAAAAAASYAAASCAAYATACAVYVADDTAAAASYAAYAAAYAADYAAAAARAAARAADYADYAVAKEETLKRCAGIVRRYFPWEAVEPLYQAALERSKL